MSLGEVPPWCEDHEGRKGLRSHTHASTRVSDREVSLLLQPRRGFLSASGTSAVWVTIFCDHKAMMGSPIGGCCMGPSRERSGAHVRGSPRSLPVKLVVGASP